MSKNKAGVGADIGSWSRHSRQIPPLRDTPIAVVAKRAGTSAVYKPERQR